jgi:hypothetical protein
MTAVCAPNWRFALSQFRVLLACRPKNEATTIDWEGSVVKDTDHFCQRAPLASVSRPLGRRVWRQERLARQRRRAHDVQVRTYKTRDVRVRAPPGTFEKHERATWQSYVLSEFVRPTGRPSSITTPSTKPRRKERKVVLDGEYPKHIRWEGSLPRFKILPSLALFACFEKTDLC